MIGGSGVKRRAADKRRREGAKSQAAFRFETELECGKPAPRISAVELASYGFHKSSETKDKDILEDVLQGANLSDASFTFAEMYISWETEDVISNELGRNLALAMAVIFVITLIMLVDLRLCLMVLVTVAFTMVDVIGMVYFWGLTIDTITCMAFIVIVGLCVDYSAHIAHAFRVAKGPTGSDR